jgi:hypothetical protein
VQIPFSQLKSQRRTAAKTDASQSIIRRVRDLRLRTRKNILFPPFPFACIFPPDKFHYAGENCLTKTKNRTGSCFSALSCTVFFARSFYSSMGCIASTGQTSSQAPQSIQVSGSISYLVSPSEIASTGHSAWQEPQEIHSPLITRGKPDTFLSSL